MVLGKRSSKFHARGVTLVDRIPSLKELLAADYATFHERGREYYFYAASWALVHAIEHGSVQLKQRGRDYMMRLAKGERPGDAWQAAFAGVDSRTLEDASQDQLTAFGVGVLQGPYAPPPVALGAARRLDDNEGHFLRLATRPWSKN